MTKVRLTAGSYVQPRDYDNPKRDETTLRRQGEVFDVGDNELARLRDIEAVEDYHGDNDPDKALLDLLDSQLKRMREEHQTLSDRQGVHPREVQLSETRLREAERTLEHARRGRPVDLYAQRPDGTTSPGPRLPGETPYPGVVATDPEGAKQAERQGGQGQAKGTGSKGSASKG